MQLLQQKMASRRNRKAQKKAVIKENKIIQHSENRKPQLGLKTRHNTPLLTEVSINIPKREELPQKRQFKEHKRGQNVTSTDQTNKMSPSKRAKTERYSATSSIGAS